MRLAPGHTQAAYNLGFVLQTRQEWEAAAAAYEQALAVNPRLPEAENNLGFVRHCQGRLKPAVEAYAPFAGQMGLCQWFHFEDHRLGDAVAWMKRLGVRHLRTGLSWADSYRPDALAWFDRQMEALADFDVTVTFCFTPEHRGVEPHHTSPPQVAEEFAEFCAQMVRRYA